MKIDCWKKNHRFIERYNTDIVFPCHEEIRSVKSERHPNCVLWIFLELHVAAAWQKCDMFSFGEIPTFKRYRGGADRYRLYEHEFPSREYNLPAWRSHDFVLVTSSYSCKKKIIFSELIELLTSNISVNLPSCTMIRPSWVEGLSKLILSIIISEFELT